MTDNLVFKMKSIPKQIMLKTQDNSIFINKALFEKKIFVNCICIRQFYCNNTVIYCLRRFLGFVSWKYIFHDFK